MARLPVVALALAGAVASLACLARARRARPGARAPWALLAVALALEVGWTLLARPLAAVGDAWTVRPGPLTAAHRIGDAAHLAAVPLVVAALALLPRAPGGRLRRARLLADAVAATLAGVLVLRWVLPAAVPAADPSDAVLLGAQAGGAVLVATAAVLALGRVPRPGAASWASSGPTAAGVLLVVASDVTARLSPEGGQGTPTVAALAMGLAGFGLVALGARRQALARLPRGDGGSRRAVVALAGALPVVLAGAVLLAGAANGGVGRPDAAEAGLLVAVLLAAALSRAEAQALARTLEDQVSARTLALGSREKWFRSLVHHASDVVTVLDPYGVVRYQTPSVRQLLGYGPGDLVGTPFERLLTAADEDRLGEALLAAVRHPGEPETLDLEVRHRDGHRVRTSATVTSLLDDADVGGLVVTLHDITEHRRLQEELTVAASTDALTGLANRAEFGERVRHAVDGARPGTVGVLFIDLDGFKAVNDSLGHQTGDRLLEVVALRLRGCVRPDDLVARLGGDEFAILVRGAGADDATTWVARRVWQQMAHPVHLDGRDVTLGASTGVAVNERGDETGEQLLRNADLAMYRAKAENRAMFVRFEEQMRQAAQVRQRRQSELRQALVRGEIAVRYEPLVELATGRVLGAAARARWEHPSDGALPPGELQELVAETGLGPEIGSWTLREACMRAAAWRDRGDLGAPWRLMVGLTDGQVVPGWPRVVREVLAATGLPPEVLTLEVPEPLLTERGDEVVELLLGVRRLGVGLALADVGRGRTSLPGLARVPVDLLTVGSTLVEPLGRPTASAAEAAAVVRTVVRLGLALGVPTVADGVTTERQRTALLEQGCALGRGPLFESAPLPVIQGSALGS